ncbi:hypothetical protein OG892_21375 [Streptomyces sp. NBC_00341]|uniref:hypothetical protein n=1 Tax=unclassified Streptomyces TaxID=2593676 RepID=UPI002E2BACF4|nr:hypothetical protein [Streptomyces sp. NBC_00304]WRZ13128.1 hypothetical protein OG892_21375 [Streptomyces sp. NBC_00341]
MTAMPKPDTEEADSEAAYRVFLGHTTQCAACRAGAPCATAARLGRAWRQARR